MVRATELGFVRSSNGTTSIIHKQSFQHPDSSIYHKITDGDEEIDTIPDELNDLIQNPLLPGGEL